MTENINISSPDINMEREVMLAKEGKYLTFELGNEVYGIEILKVQEIMRMMNVTHVPRTPDFVRGIVNLRGKVIPVMDLRLKFGLERKEDSNRTCIIVSQIKLKDVYVTMGTIVDEVSEVLEIKKAQIEEVPSFGGIADIEFIMGIGKVRDKVIMLLDVDKAFTGVDLFTLKKLSKI